jgi:heat shock protein HslJ
MRSFLLGLVGILIGGCGQESNPPTGKADESIPTSVMAPMKEYIDESLTGSWVLIRLPKSAHEIDELYPRQKPIIQIQPGMNSFSGSTGCNRFSAPLRAYNNNFIRGELTRSTLDCLGNAEQEFLTALDSSKNYELNDRGELILKNQQDSWAVFQKSSTAGFQKGAN